MYQQLKIIVTVCILAILFLGNNLNPPNGKTGAPFDGSCKDCHQSTNPNYSGKLSLDGLPDAVKIGETYPLELSMTLIKGSPKRSGFQMVSVGTSSLENGGIFEVSEEKTAIFTKKDRSYVEHKSPKNFNGENKVTWKFNWTVDAISSDTIEFYAASILANGAENSDDRVVKTSFKVAIDKSTGTELLETIEWTIFPNPVNSQINIDIEKVQFKGQILDMYGKVNLNFENNRSIDISNLPNGVYFLQIEQEMKRFIKI